MVDYNFDEIISDPPEVAASRIARSYLQTQPEAAAKSIQLAPQSGLPPQIIRQDPAAVAGQVQADQNVQILQQHPAIAQVAATPTHYEAMADDLPALAAAKIASQQDSFFGNMEKFWADPSGYLSQRNAAVGETLGVGQGMEEEAYGRAASQYQLGDKSKLPLLQQYEAQKQYSPEGMLGKTVHNLGMMAGQIVEATRAGGAAGMAGGAALGGVTGGPVGAAAGATLGLEYGTLGEMVQSSTGRAYRQMDLARDPTGAPIPEPLKQAAAVTVGAVSGMFFSKMGAKTGEQLGGLVTAGLTKALSDKAVSSIAGQALTSAAKNGLTFAMLNAGLTVAGAVLPDVAKGESNYFNDTQFQTLFNDPKKRDEFVEQVRQSAIEGLAAGGVLGALGVLPIGANRFLDQMHIKQVESEAATRDNTFAAADVTKLKERAPELLSRIMDNGKTVDVSADAMAAARQADTTAFNYVPDVDRRIAEAQEHGGDVSIPTGEYFAKTAAEHHEAVKDDIRSDNGLTPREAADLGAKTQEVLTQAPQGEASPVPEARTPLEGAAEQVDAFSVVEHAHEPTGDPVHDATADAVSTNLAAERKLMWLDPILTPDAAGMTADNFARYSKKIQDLQADLTKGVFDAAIKEVTRREKPLWKDALARAAERIRGELYARRDIAADRLLREGIGPDGQLDPALRPKLDREAARELFGASRDSEGGVDPTATINPKVWSKDAGLHPDDAAALTGHGSGLELLRDLQRLEKERNAAGLSPKDHLESLVKAMAQEDVEATHGKFDERVLKEAIDLAMSVKQVDVLAEELQALGGNKVDRQAVERLVKEKFGRLNAEEAGKFENFQRLAGKYGEEAHRALLKGDVLAAFVAKQRQLTNFLLAKESQTLRAEMAKFSKVISRYTDKLVPDGTDPVFTAHIQKILSNFGFEMKRTPGELASYLGKQEPFDTFIAGLKHEQGRDLSDVIPDWVKTPRDLRSLSADELRGLHKAIGSLDEVGRAQKRLDILGQKLDLSDQVGDFRDRMSLREDRAPITRPADMGKAWLKDTFHKIHAGLVYPEMMFKWFDLHDPDGPASRIMRAIQQSKYLQSDMTAEYGKKIKDLSHGKEWEKALQHKVPNDSLYDPVTMEPRDFTRAEMISIAKHMGSELNEKKLIDGMNAAGKERRGDLWNTFTWDRATVDDWLRRNMTEADWKHVQGTWDLFEELWPKVEDLCHEMNGVAPEKREARPLTTPAGTKLRGGYMPLAKDPLRSPFGGEGTRGPFDEGNFLSTKPPAGHSKAVTGALYALDLSPGATSKAVAQVIHDLAFRKTLTEAHKFFSQKEVRQLISDKFGEQTSKNIKGWLEDVAGSGGWAAANRGVEGLAAILRYERQNWGAANLVLRATALSKHGASVFGQSIGQVGAKPFFSEMKAIWGNPLKWSERLDELKELSGELRTRSRTMNENIVDAGMPLNFGDKLGLGQMLANVGHHVYNTIDMMSAAPTFSAAYKQALAAGKSEEVARAMGDQAVRAAHGSYNIVDRPATWRNKNELVKDGMVALGFFNHVYNNYADLMQTGRDLKAGIVPEDVKISQHGYNWTGIFFKTLTYSIVMSLIEDTFSPQPRKKDEGEAMYLTRMMLRIPLSSIPFANEGLNMLLGEDTKSAPAGFAANAKAFSATMGNAWRTLEGKPAKPGAIKSASQATALVAPIPGVVQAGSTSQFLWDLNHGVQHANGFWQWYYGLTTGNSHPGERRH